jgi:hypothetical protein
MIRRCRPLREIAFSFDSFLDVVANVVGIILRLILVAWVGARTYKGIAPPPLPPPPALSDPTPLPEPTDPRLARTQQRRRQIQHEAEDLERRQEDRRRHAVLREQALEKELSDLADRQKAILAEDADAKRQAERGSAAARTAQLSLTELEKRSRALLRDLDTLGKLPRVTKKLRYNTPVSAPLQTDEAMFECLHGRITLVDWGALQAAAMREARTKESLLRDRWEVRDVTVAVGAFRFRYVVERERSAFDGPGRGAPMSNRFRYGLAAWEAEPVIADRGETVEQALKPGSAFRKVIDALDPQQTAVTLWVYPDSFAAYRAIRDYLHKREVVVAGRPLPEGVPIASSRKGTKSRGQ